MTLLIQIKTSDWQANFYIQMFKRLHIIDYKNERDTLQMRI